MKLQKGTCAEMCREALKGEGNSGKSRGHEREMLGKYNGHEGGEMK